MNFANRIRPPFTDFKLPVIKNFNGDDIDSIIKNRIEKLTSENSTIWTSPEYNRREYVHGIFQYPAMMVPVVQKYIIDIIKQANPAIQNVIDPFMGSATSLVACMENGLTCYGQDINPLAILIGQVRTGPYTTNLLKTSVQRLFENVVVDNSKSIEVNFKGQSKWFKPEVSEELSKLVRAIRAEENIDLRKFYWVNLAEVVRLTSNDRTSTFKLHARPVDEINSRHSSPINEFKTRVFRTIKDLEVYRNLLIDCDQLEDDSYRPGKFINLQDSSKLIWHPEGETEFFDLLVTSPPYGDNKTTVTYGQHSFLPLQWIDLEDIDSRANRDFLKTTMEIDTRSLGGRSRSLTKEEIETLCNISSTFKATYKELLTTTIDRVNKVLGFLNDLYMVIQQVFKVMKAGSYQVWTIGNRTVGGIEIPNNLILIDMINSLNGKLVTEVKREILNKRMARRNNDSTLMNFENILIFRKIV